MKHWLMLVLALFLSACSSGTVPATPTAAVAKPGRVTSAELFADPQRWVGEPLTVISPATLLAEHAVLVPQLGPPGDAAIWLGGALPAEVAQALGAGPAVVKAQGELGPPGAYGPDGRYPYQLTITAISVVQPERTTLANLVANRGALDQVLLEVHGTLLSAPPTLLLADQVGPGGVPDAGAAQIKLPALPDQAVLGRLGAHGSVRYGAVRVIGWLAGGVLTPWLVVAEP